MDNNDTGLVWFKSEKSAHNGGCAEVARTGDGGMAVRNSRDPQGAQLRFDANEWDCFLDGARKGEFNLA
jgi:hypothetical protein